MTSSMVPERDEPAALDDSHLVAELFRYLQHMGGEEDGTAVVADLTHHALEQVGSFGV